MTSPHPDHPVIGHEEALRLHGQPVHPADIRALLRWDAMLEPVKSELAKLGRPERSTYIRAHNKARTLFEFLDQRFGSNGSPFFDWTEYALWNEKRPKPGASKPISQAAWAKNFPGAFGRCFRLFPYRVVTDGASVGLAIVPVQGPSESAARYCLVYRYSQRPPAFAGLIEPKPEPPSKNHAEFLSVAQIESKIETPTRVPSPPRPIYHCLRPSELRGLERNNNWMLSAITYLDGMTSGPHPDHLGAILPDVHPPAVIEAARLKLESEEDGFCFLVENHTPVGYASLWRVSLDSSSDLFEWIKGSGTMPYHKALLNMEPWNPLNQPPQVSIGYISSLRIHPRCRYNPLDEDGMAARRMLFDGVVRMLVRYAKRGQLFLELVVWTSHIHERTFLQNIRGEHPVEAGESHNVLRLRLWSPSLGTGVLKGQIFKDLAALYEPFSPLLAEAARKLRRRQEGTDFDGLDE